MSDLAVSLHEVGAMDARTMQDLKDRPILALVPFTPEHFDTLAGWFSDERELLQWAGAGVSFPLTGPQMQAMAAEDAGARPARLCRTAVTEAGGIAGHVQVVLDREHGVGRLARVAVAPEMRGRNLAAPMLELALEELFADPAMERAELNVFTWNTPALRVYERLGFRMEGVRRSSVRAGSERWDTAMMGMLRSEWDERG